MTLDSGNRKMLKVFVFNRFNFFNFVRKTAQSRAENDCRFGLKLGDFANNFKTYLQFSQI